jgi:hypothetical protein
MIDIFIILILFFFTSAARFRTGNYNLLTGGAAGTSMDYSVGVDDVPLAYTIFAPPFGQNGWDVEPWRINPIVDQVFFALEDLARHALFSPSNKKHKVIDEARV